MATPAIALPADLVEIEGRAGGRGLAAARAFRRGERVSRIPVTARHSRPTHLTVRLGRGEHVEVGWLATLNHSCDPNVRLDIDRMEVVAERDVGPGEELTYFYPSTEWDMAEPFECGCGSSRCLGWIRGAGHVDPAVLAGYFLTRSVRGRLARRPG